MHYRVGKKKFKKYSSNALLSHFCLNGKKAPRRCFFWTDKHSIKEKVLPKHNSKLWRSTKDKCKINSFKEKPSFLLTIIQKLYHIFFSRVHIPSSSKTSAVCLSFDQNKHASLNMRKFLNGIHIEILILITFLNWLR